MCSKDPNIKKLLEIYSAEIVLAESSLACLIDNHGPSFERQWEMPVKVVLLPGKGKVINTVYLHAKNLCLMNFILACLAAMNNMYESIFISRKSGE